MKQQDSPLCEGSLLSTTFLSAEAMASEGTRGLSTYLGFLIGPTGMNQRYRGNEKREMQTGRERDGDKRKKKQMQKSGEWKNEREREPETEERQREKERSRWINVFQMGLEMRGGGVLVGKAWLHSVAHINLLPLRPPSTSHTHIHTLSQTASCADSCSALCENPEVCLHCQRLPVKHS